MGLFNILNKIRGGYPGGWRQYARGYQGSNTPPFMQPNDPDDRRSLIPPLGLREYWYPAVPDKDVSSKKPVGLRLLGEDITLFRDKNNEVQALWDYCPHRGVYLSWGDCFWNGFLSCPYHGATFNGDGECVEFITEGPDSKMVGQLKAKKFPTVTLKGLVFVWMGEGEPVPPEEDLPPELFEGDSSTVRVTFRHWDCNWMIALENTSDAHNCFWVHRNAIRHLRKRYGGGRPRTPIGYSNKISDNKKAVRAISGRETYYFKDGKMPYQLYYPRVGGNWPKYRWRLLWVWFFEIVDHWNRNIKPFVTPDDWLGMRLPGMQRLPGVSGPGAMYTRWCVPVDANLTRVLYLRSQRIRTKFGRLIDWLTYRLYRDFLAHYNFSDQDYDAMRSARYQYPEYLSSTDSHMIAARRLITENARGLQKSIEVVPLTTAERVSEELTNQIVTGYQNTQKMSERNQ